MARSPGDRVFRLRITLEEVVPTVWRRVLVPGDIRLGKLHRIVQAAMGWTNSHLHSFVIGDRRYGTHIDDYPPDEIDEGTVTVTAAIGKHRRFRYDYDFGDLWEHEIVVEETTSVTRALRFAVCLDGQNACPPEDCGGPPGYSELLEVLGDPDHEDHERLLRWVGRPLDPTMFDLVAANAALQHIR